jgi:hypothetical protein
MVKKKSEEELPHVTGKVKYVNITGHGPNSGHMVFVVGGETFLLTGPPPDKKVPENKDDGYEPYLFTAMANLIIAAYYDNHAVTVHYKKLPDRTNSPRQIQVPRLKKKKIESSKQ